VLRVERSEAMQACLLMPCPNVVRVRLRDGHVVPDRACRRHAKIFLGVLAVVSNKKTPASGEACGGDRCAVQFSAFVMITPRREISASSFSVSSWYLDPLKLSRVEAVSFPSSLK
jgi:hypothetical protein